VETDILGQPYLRHTMDLGDDEEGPVVATLVRRPAPAPTSRAVLWVHGWSDYFFQTHVADFFVDRGFDFYALDLRKYGRSLLSHQTATFCHSLTEYFTELDEAVRIIRNEDGHETLLLAAHSAGGLITALWAHQRRADRPVDALFLNSPFFDIDIPALLRVPARAAARRIGRRAPYRVLMRPNYPAYGHSLHIDHHGEWTYELAWKPLGGFPVRFGWLAAIRAGQQRLHAGLSIDVPILVGCSARSYRCLRWHELARQTDTVLNVADMIRWAPSLGRHVTLLRIDGAMHDLTLSAPAVRSSVFSELDRWIGGYVAAGAPAKPAVPPHLGDQVRPASRTEVPDPPPVPDPMAPPGRTVAPDRTPPAPGRTPPTAAAAAPGGPG
jgi:alpha-beta hydrolase superfamily lysophospholipase